MFSRILELLATNFKNIEDIKGKFQGKFSHLYMDEVGDRIRISNAIPKDKRDINSIKELFNSLVNYADSNNKIITLDIEFKYQKGYLTNFLKSIGFQYNIPRKDFRFSSYWFRYPNAKTKELKEPEYLSPEERKAIKYFGITNDIYEAGFILTNGSMLDLSGKRESRWNAGKRYIDHGEINFIGLTHEEAGEQLGVVRMSASRQGNSFLDIRKLPTQKQFKVMQNLISSVGGDMNVELYSPNKERFYQEYEQERPTKIIGDIRNYFS